MKDNLLLPLLLCIVVCSAAAGQSGCEKASLITLNQDTIHGLIACKALRKEKHSIKFKSSASGSITDYDPLDIISFSVNQVLYYGAMVEKEVSRLAKRNLDTNKTFFILKDTIFFKCLFMSDKALFLDREVGKKDNFYIKTHNGYELLLYKRHLAEHNKKLVVEDDRSYIGQLATYLEQCPDLHVILPEIKYDYVHLYYLFLRYNQCTNGLIVHEKGPTRMSLEFGITAGPSLTTVEFEGTGFDYITQVEYSPSVSVSIGTYADLIFPYKQKRSSIYNELLLTHFNVSSQHSEIIDSENFSTIETRFSFVHLKLNNLIRYRSSRSSLGWFANAGISNGYPISRTNCRLSSFTILGETGTRKDVALRPIRFHEVGLLIGAGINYKKVSMELRIEKSNRFTFEKPVKSTTTRIFILAGISSKELLHIKTKLTPLNLIPCGRW